MKKCISVLLCVCILLSSMLIQPVSAVTESLFSGGFGYRILDDGTAEITKYYGTSTTISIPSSIDGYTVTSIGEKAFGGDFNINFVAVPNTVVRIGKDAFSRCGRIKGVVLPESLVEIGDSAFYYCEILPSIDIPGSVRSIGKSAFGYCNKLSDITFGDSLTTVGSGAFTGTAWLNAQPDGLVYTGKVAYKYKGDPPVSLTLNAGTVGVAGGAFSSCTGLNRIYLPDSLVDIGDSAFSNCTSLESVNIPVSVTHVGASAFSGCSSLSDFNIPGSLKSIESSVFSGCSSISKITIPDSVTTIGELSFSGCTGITELDLPDHVTSIGKEAFYGCTGITGLTIPDSVTSMGDNAFKGCENLEFFDTGDGITSLDCLLTGTDDNKKLSKLRYIRFGTSIKEIGYEAFKNFKSLQSITVDGPTVIGKLAFAFCENLTDIAISPSVDDIDSDPFFHTAWLDSQPYGPIYAGKVLYSYKADKDHPSPQTVVLRADTTGIAYAALSGTNNTEIISSIPSSVRCIGRGAFSGFRLNNSAMPSSLKTIRPYAFSGTVGFGTVVLPYGLTEIGDYAFSRSDLSAVYIPESVETIGDYAFSGCSELEDIFVTDTLIEIKHSVFSNTAWIKNQPDGVIYLGKIAYGIKGEYTDDLIIKDGTIGMAVGAFYFCKIKHVVIPDSVIAISEEAFNGCLDLETITIPVSVTYIGANAFNGCSSVRDIYYLGSESQWNDIDNRSYPLIMQNAITVYRDYTIHYEVMAAKVKSFKVDRDSINCKLGQYPVINAVLTLTVDGFADEKIITDYATSKLKWNVGNTSVADIQTLTVTVSDDCRIASVRVMFKTKKTGSCRMNPSFSADYLAEGVEISAPFTIKVSPSTGYLAEADGWCIGNKAHSFGGDNYHNSIITDLKNFGFSNPWTALVSEVGLIIDGIRQFQDFGGNCYGMSLLSIANHNGTIDLKEYFDNNGKYLAEYGYEVKFDDSYYTVKGNSKIVNLIERCQAVQLSLTIKKYRLSDMGLSELIDYMSDSAKAKPLLTSFSAKDEKGKTINHTIVLDPSEAPKQLDGGWYELKIYDPNCPQGSYTLGSPYEDYSWTSSLMVNPGQDKWEYSVLDWNNKTIKNVSGTTTNDFGFKRIKFYDVSKLPKAIFDPAVPLDTYRYAVTTIFEDYLEMSNNSGNILEMNNGELKKLKEGYDCDPISGGEGSAYNFIGLNDDQVSYEATNALTFFVDSEKKHNGIAVVGKSTVSINRSKNTVQISAHKKTEFTYFFEAGDGRIVAVDADLSPGYTLGVSKNSEDVTFNSNDKITVNVAYSDDQDNIVQTTVTVNGKTPLDFTELPHPDSVIRGDADGDGDVTILDATAIQRHLAELPTKAYVEAASDADEDSEVTILDATAIQRWLAGLPTNANIGKKI